MKVFAIIFGSIVITQYCTAAPQRGDPEDEVELIPATNTNQRDPESGFPFLGNGDTLGNGFPVIIVRTSSGGKNPLHTLLNNFFGRSGSTDEEEFEGDKEDIPEIPLSNFPDLSTILGVSKKESNEGEVTAEDEFFPNFPAIFKKPASDGEKKCGLLCKLLKNFDTQLKHIEEEVREIRDKERERENEISQGNDEETNGPVNEYTEEVLSDGTIVRTNKTYSTSEDGSSFFSFQSTSVNSFGHSSETKTEEKTDENDAVTMDNDSGDVLDEETVSVGNIPQKEYEDVEEEREELASILDEEEDENYYEK